MPKLKNEISILRKDDGDVDFIIPDNREGWVKLLGKVLKAHYYSGEGFTYSCGSIRGKGTPIKSFGGTASGPEELHKGIQLIHEILNSRALKKLRPVNCLDIMNIIGEIVVSGNVRRSAQIAIGDYDDMDYLKAKRWDLGPIPNWRANSNNSVVCDNTDRLPQEYWDTYEQGEPYGLINLKLARAIGRTGDTNYPDPDVQIFNPCAEQGLADKESCCLSEMYLPNIDSYDEFLRCLTLSYRVNKHSLTLKCSLKDTEEIVHKNMRMGIGITGLLQCTKEQRSWLSPAYKYLRGFDEEYSNIHGFNKSIKLTTCKPSGTLSLLPKITKTDEGVIVPGVHPNPAGPYYIRRIRISSDSQLIQVCKNHGYKLEYKKNFDGSEDKTTMVVEFPCKVSETTPVAANYTWREQLETVRWLQTNWSDNSVSCTVYYKKEDIDDIKKYLSDNFTVNFKTVSFLLYHGHGFVQAPYETISKEDYLLMVKNTTPITSVEIKESDFDIDECSSGACPVK